MMEWHVPFDHIEERWTYRQLMMFVGRANERKKDEARAAKPGAGRRKYVDVLRGQGIN